MTAMATIAYVVLWRKRELRNQLSYWIRYLGVYHDNKRYISISWRYPWRYHDRDGPPYSAVWSVEVLIAFGIKEKKKPVGKFEFPISSQMEVENSLSLFSTLEKKETHIIYRKEVLIPMEELLVTW